MDQPLNESIVGSGRRAMAWVLKDLSLFNPLCESSPKKAMFKIKAATELAMACAARRALTLELDSSASLAARYLWEEVFSQPALQDFLLADPGKLAALDLYAALRACGYEDPVYRARLAETLDYRRAVERAPFRTMDLIYSLRRAELPCGGVDLGGLYGETVLGKRPDVYHVTTMDAYAMTHTIFFVTDFGTTSPSIFSRADREYFETQLPRIAEYFLRKGDWDLTAELLWVLCSLRLERLPVYEQGWWELLRVQNADGSFPPSMSDDGEVKDEFDRNYHTTLAVLLAHDACLSRTY
ncbi:MAG: hypothetical protein GY719_41045 [bacterium]|nr:hypothetical protein [bacterium]